MKKDSKVLLAGAVSLGLFVPATSHAFALADMGMCAANPIPFHTSIFGYSFDVGSAAGRILTTAVKYFLSDDTDLVAELVWKEGCGGCGGCYGKSSAKNSADLKLAAVSGDISIEEGVYRAGTSVGKSCVADLAQQRLDNTVAELASLHSLNAKAWTLQYDSQRRSIQALTDALNMKRLYSQIKDLATSSPSDYSDYSAAVSSVASKRLLLDELLALKKRVIAARIRTRAQTIEVNGADFARITVAPDLGDACRGAAGGEGDGLTCKPDQYMIDEGKKCEQCPAHFVPNKDGHKDDFCMCENGYEWSRDSHTCEAKAGALTCQPRQYMSDDGQKCEECPADHVIDNQDGHSESSCRCEDGYEWSSGSHTCEARSSS